MINEVELKRQMKIAIESTNSMASASRLLKLSYKKFKYYAIKFELFQPNQGLKGTFKSKIDINDILNNKVKISSYNLKNKLLNNNILEEKCYNPKCNISVEWLGKKITLELDHIDGDNNNNSLNNLRLLCPNCHSQTPTYRGKNINNRKHKYSDKEFISAVNNSLNIKQVCTKLGLVPKGGNYKTVRNKMDELGLNFPELITFKDKQPKIKNKVENFCSCGTKINKKSKKCVTCYQKSQRKVNRPPKEQLLKEVNDLGYCATGRKYGVSDNAIRKWLK